MKEKTLELKKIIELIKQITYEKKNKKNTIPEALISTNEKHIIKEEPIQRMQTEIQQQPNSGKINRRRNKRTGRTNQQATQKKAFTT